MTPEDGQTAITVRDLTKRFGEVHAVAGIDFEVQAGELFGFLGPNGAGKSTTINMLIGLARPDTGMIRISGIDCSKKPKAAQHLMGVVPDESNLYPELSGFDNLSFCGALYGMTKHVREARAYELLNKFGLAKAGGRTFGSYSKGMKRKLTIAAGIIHSPPILFMDEPTTGIDVASARQIRQLIAELNAGGTTVFLTTHYIEEAERLCRRIAFIVEGRIVRTDTVEELLRRSDGRHVVRVALSASAARVSAAITSACPELSCRAESEDALRVESSQPVRVGPLVRVIEEGGVEVTEVRKLTPSLEDIFVEITGIEAGAMQQEREKSGKRGGA